MRINYLLFKEALAPLICFSLHDIRKHFPKFDRKRLTQWQQKGYIHQVIRGYYLFADIEKSRELWWFVANKIFGPSYISLHAALEHYGFIPEAVFQITSVTTRKTSIFDTRIKSFSYRHIKPAAFFGYTLIDWKDRYIKMAQPEKAILDFLYLHAELKTMDDFDAMRWNNQMIAEQVNWEKMEKYALAMGNKSLLHRLDTLKDWHHAAIG